MRILFWKIAHIKKWMQNHFELLFFTFSIFALFFMPEKHSGESFCLFRQMGFSFCPGCGIGHSIHYALRGEFQTSFKYHPLGIVAVIIIFMRIKQLLFKPKPIYETKPHNIDPGN